MEEALSIMWPISKCRSTCVWLVCTWLSQWHHFDSQHISEGPLRVPCRVTSACTWSTPWMHACFVGNCVWCAFPLMCLSWNHELDHRLLSWASSSISTCTLLYEWLIWNGKVSHELCWDVYRLWDSTIPIYFNHTSDCSVQYLKGTTN